MKRFALLSAAATIRATVVVGPLVCFAVGFAAWNKQISYSIALALCGVCCLNCLGLIAFSAAAVSLLEKKTNQVACN